MSYERKRPVWELVYEDSGNKEIIRDVANNENFLFLASTGFGTRSSTVDLAKEVVAYLNSRPQTAL